MNTEPYLSTMLRQLSAIVRDVFENGSLYTKEELEEVEVLAEKLALHAKTNIENNNYFEC
jgi:hypothetical protein